MGDNARPAIEGYQAKPQSLALFPDLPRVETRETPTFLLLGKAAIRRRYRTCAKRLIAARWSRRVRP